MTRHAPPNEPLQCLPGRLRDEEPITGRRMPPPDYKLRRATYKFAAAADPDSGALSVYALGTVQGALVAFLLLRRAKSGAPT